MDPARERPPRTTGQEREQIHFLQPKSTMADKSNVSETKARNTPFPSLFFGKVRIDREDPWDERF